jgi:hypothetical protein
MTEQASPGLDENIHACRASNELADAQGRHQDGLG